MRHDRDLAAFSAFSVGLVVGWMVHRLAPPRPLLVKVLPMTGGAPSERERGEIAGRPSFEEKLCRLQDELIRAGVGPDRWDFYEWDKGPEREPVHLRNAGQTQNHRVLTLYKTKDDGTLDDEGMLVPIERLTKIPNL